MSKENVVTIKEFSRKVHTFIAKATQGEVFVLTLYGKPVVRIEKVHTLDTKEAKKVHTLEAPVKTQSEVIDELRQKTAEIIAKVDTLPEESKHYCAVCKKLFRREREAIEEVELMSNDIYRKEWVCQEHKAKYALC